ncbi:MAG TPA: bifunctional hydroxymethylpyrimidine kinase/phosphomethylpyrimidine kinase [Stellaceae bacterium]|nr:bifunctional hydroxymethylpyrimidine kinase/phosphomethylpyrimidine kinase [Stellaceae bacterium]
MKGRVLIVAGSDSSGGAGIQADIKTVTALGGYAATAVTALTAQNTLGVLDIMRVDARFVRRQIEAVLDDIGADCIKTGMLVDAEIIGAVADSLPTKSEIPLVVDPVMLSTSGARLLDPAGVETLMHRLIVRATVLTPNLPEAEALLGRRIADSADMDAAAKTLQQLGAKIVVLKGGHFPGSTVRDVVVGDGVAYALESPRIETRHTHGTGCTLASAIATGLAQGLAPRKAIERAHVFVREAIRTAPGFGKGNGPLNHAHTLREEP